jgi:hypothetical protein
MQTSKKKPFTSACMPELDAGEAGGKKRIKAKNKGLGLVVVNWLQRGFEVSMSSHGKITQSTQKLHRRLGGKPASSSKSTQITQSTQLLGKVSKFSSTWTPPLEDPLGKLSEKLCTLCNFCHSWS